MTNRVDAIKVEKFIAESIMSLFPDFTISQGDPFYDLYIRFFSLTALIDILKVVESQENKFGYDNYSLPSEEYNLLLKRWFKEIEQGSLTTLSVTLVFSDNKNLFTVRPKDEFIINSAYFNPTETFQIFSADYTEELTLNNTTEYRIRIALTANEIDPETVFSPGDIVTIPYISATGFLRAFVNDDIEVGRDTETNEAAFQRLTQTIGTDNWVNNQSISVNMFDKLRGVVNNYQVIGHGAPEMFRDVLNVTIPKRLMKLTFSEKTPVNLRQKDDEGNLITVVWFNSNPDIKYTIKHDITKTVTENWDIDELGNYYLESELLLLSKANPFGFAEDYSCDIKQNVIDSITKEIINITDYNPPALLSSVSKTVTANSYNSTVHTGGFMDLYVQANVIRAERKIYLAVNSEGLYSIPKELTPILKVNNITDNAGLEVDLWTFLPGAASKRFSVEDDSKIFINPAYEARELTIDLFYMPSVPLIDSTVNNPQTRLIQPNVLVKTKIPVFVNALVEVELAGNDDFNMLSLLRNSFNWYVNNLINTRELSLLKVLGVLERESGGRVTIKSFSAEATQYMPDGQEIYLNGDAVIEAVIDESLGVSARTLKFIPENIEFILI